MSRKQPSLLFCILMDMVGYATYSIPVLGEFADLLWAPVSAMIFFASFGSWKGALGGVFNFVEEYPGIYSRSGVKAIIKVVAIIRNSAVSVLKTNTFNLFSLNAKRSTKVSSLSITNRYLCNNFLLKRFAPFSLFVMPCNSFLQI